MDQQIRHEENRILVFLTNADFHGRAVLLHHHAMDGKGNSHPLVFLHTAVIVRIQISEAAVLIERILLDIQSRGVDMGAENVDAVRHLIRSDLEQDDGLIHPYGVDAISRLQLIAGFHHCLQLPVSFFFDQIHDLVNALTLRLAVVQKFHIFL